MGFLGVFVSKELFLRSEQSGALPTELSRNVFGFF